MSLAEDLRLALVWDPDGLRASADRATTQFRSAMHLQFLHATEDVDVTHPLYLAAQGLAQEYDDREDEAIRSYQELSAHHLVEARLIGLSFSAWVGQGSAAPLRKALREAEALPFADFRLRLSVFCKLLAISLDIAELDVAQQCLDSALSCLPEPSSLRVSLNEIGHYNLGRDLTISQEDLDAPDRLGAEAHVVALLGAASSRTLDQAFVDSVRSPLRQWIRFGSGNLDDVSAAELQATWMGAPWLVRRARRQLGVQLLSGAAETSVNYELGLAYWFLGKGGDALQVGETVETHLSSTSAEAVLIQHLRGGRRYGDRGAYVKAASALWSVLSPPLLGDALQNTLPSERGTETELDDAAIVLWTTGAVTAPATWRDLFSRLTETMQMIVFAAMGEGILRRLPDDEADFLYNLGLRQRTAGSDHRDAVDRQLLVLHLISPDRRLLPSDFIDSLTDATIFWLGREGRHLVGDDDRRERLDSLLPFVENMVQASRSGTTAGYATNPLLTLGGIAGAASTPFIDVERVLIATIVDDRVDTGYRLSALSGLMRYVEQHSLTEESRTKLRDVPLRDAHPFFDRAPEELMRARQLNVLFKIGEQAHRWEIVELGRHPEARVRTEALSALRHLSSTVEFELALSGALFDPTATIVRTAVELAADNWDSLSLPLRQVTVRRVRALYETGTAEDRATAVRAARAIQDKSVHEALTHILNIAADDRSWLVRDAVASGQRS